MQSDIEQPQDIVAVCCAQGNCPADLNGDGVVDGQDLAALLSPEELDMIDTDKDGRVSVEEYRAYLLARGAVTIFMVQAKTRRCAATPAALDTASALRGTPHTPTPPPHRDPSRAAPRAPRNAPPPPPNVRPAPVVVSLLGYSRWLYDWHSSGAL